MRYTMIRTENLVKEYKNRPVVKGLTFEVEPGEVFGFLGSDGAGKTTTIRMLLDYVRPTEGRAFVLNMDSHKQSVAIRKQVGYLPENLALYGHMTGEQLLTYLSRLRGQVSKAYVDELVQRLGATTNKPVGRLNEAQRRKLGLVQAFMHTPELLILDEPTRGLDDDTRQAFYSLVSQVRSEGRAVFVASNSLAEMERVCDRVGILYRGELLAVERGVTLRSKALRHVEMRFAGPVTAEDFACLPNLQDLRLDDNQLFCTVRGDPDALIKTASRFRVTDFVSQRPSLDEMFNHYYGVPGIAA